MLFIVLETSLQIFAAWTLAYHLSLLIKLPAQAICIPFAAVLLPMLALSFRRWREAVGYTWRERKKNRWFALVTVGPAG